MLVVMHNNRAYYKRLAHQIRMAKLRALRAKAISAWTCTVRSPTSARSRVHCCYGEGPIDKRRTCSRRSRRAIAEVKKAGSRLVDTIIPAPVTQVDKRRQHESARESGPIYICGADS